MALQRRNILLLIITLSFTQVAQVNDGRWYAGNYQNSSYGAKSKIWTPSWAPALYDSGESNWVSIYASTWIQTGWRYYQGYPAAKSYFEYLDLDGIFNAVNTETHLWNDIVEYRIEHLSGVMWCAYIADVSVWCDNVHSAPWTVMVSSEVHQHPMNELDTFFSDIYYRNSSGNWYRFNQHLWLDEFPYSTAKYDPSYFRAYRLDTKDIFVPLIRR